MIRTWLRRRRAAAQWQRLAGRIAAESASRKAAVQLYRPAVDATSEILFRHDPIGINFEENTDEYDAEAESIMLNLLKHPQPRSVGELQQMIHWEFVHWFGESIAGPAPRYRLIAEEVWARRGNWPGGAPHSALPPPNSPPSV